MIKLNLLPQYVIEYRRIRLLIIVFVVALVFEGGIVFKAYTDLKAQAAWFVNDKSYYDTRQKKIADAKAKADAAEAKQNSYKPYNDFFQRDAVLKYNHQMVACLQEVAGLVGGQPAAWFDDLTLDKSSVTMHGKIKGLMNFVNFYFKMKDTGMKLEPAAQPASSPKSPTLNQEVALQVSGSIKSALPDKPPLPQGETPKTPGDLYIPYKGASAPGGAPGAPAK